MTHKNNLITLGLQAPLLTKRLVTGAAVACCMILLFLYFGSPANEGLQPWMIRPMIVVTAAGATGAGFYHLMTICRIRFGWSSILINTLCVVVYITGLWLGTILGLDGMWWE